MFKYHAKIEISLDYTDIFTLFAGKEFQITWNQFLEYNRITAKSPKNGLLLKMKQKIKRIVVVGAGPAGMAAALEACRAGKEVILVDKNAITGRKLRITGGGRGNLSNLNAAAHKYYSHDTGFIEKIIDRFPPEEIIAYLQKLGILTWHTDDGWVYPVSNSAVNTAIMLEARLTEAGVKLKLETGVKDILTGTDAIRVITTQGEEISCCGLVIASGGKAYPELGSTGELFRVLEGLGHRVWPVRPALAPVVTDMKAIHKLQGVRLDAGVSLRARSGVIAETTGNIIFTNWGINGPGVMDISHWVNEYLDQGLFLQVDFLGQNAAEFLALLEHERQAKLGIGPLLGAVLPPKLTGFLLERASISAETSMRDIGDDSLDRLLRLVRQFRIGVKEVKSFDQCQVSAGGIALSEVDPANMQSKRLPGLFFAGELLDAAGPCGGYNLHWAFSTGILAGRGAGQAI